MGFRGISDTLIFEPHYITVPGADRLLRIGICIDPSVPPVLMLHGVIEKGKFFTNE